MKSYARLESRVVAEIITTGRDIATLFHPSLVWVDVTGQTVQVGWTRRDDGTFASPPAPSSPQTASAAAQTSPSTAELLAELTTLRAQVAQLHIG